MIKPCREITHVGTNLLTVRVRAFSGDAAHDFIAREMLAAPRAIRIRPSMASPLPAP